MNAGSKRFFRNLIVGIVVLFLSCIVLETIANAKVCDGSRGLSGITQEQDYR